MFVPSRVGEGDLLREADCPLLGNLHREGEKLKGKLGSTDFLSSVSSAWRKEVVPLAGVEPTEFIELFDRMAFHSDGSGRCG